jgi:NADH:ubiquinone reductase (non-electrogenic)
MAKLGEHQQNRRGLTVDDHLVLAGSNGSIFALGDCTATLYAPTAQVAAQQGHYLARIFSQIAARDKYQAEVDELKRTKAPLEDIDTATRKLSKASVLRPFHYTHQGSLAYIGSDRAIADMPFMNGNVSCLSRAEIVCC